jgi:hypothetical protein
MLEILKDWVLELFVWLNSIDVEQWGMASGYFSKE